MNLTRLLPALLLSSVLASAANPEPRWWKGNLHTHTLWSDGDDYPEMVTDWYKKQGYHFLALSDHNIMQVDQRWLVATNPTPGFKALAPYLQRFGTNWVHQGETKGTAIVRLKTLAEFRSTFEEPGRFLLIPAEEITDHFKNRAVHLIGVNLRDVIRPQGGTNVEATIQNNVNAVLRQRAATGQPMFPHLAHPNFGWGVTAEDLMGVKGEQFFEVYNGHAAVHNAGDAAHPGTERMWDIILTQRLARLGEPPMFGLAVDDAHNYARLGRTRSNPGRGWVMVRAAQLTPETIVGALERGDFYSSTGVRVSEINWETNRLALTIEQEPGATYTTQFIGTRRGFDPASQPVLGTNGLPLAITRTYSKDIGVLLAETPGLTPSFKLKGDELYVRAKVISSKPKANGVRSDEVESAWVQPQVTPLGWSVNQAAATRRQEK